MLSVEHQSLIYQHCYNNVFETLQDFSLDYIISNIVYLFISIVCRSKGMTLNSNSVYLYELIDGLKWANYVLHC